jgi:hypothetical protein
MYDDTDFIGCIRVSPPLNEQEVGVLRDLTGSGRTLRSTPTGRGNSEVPFAPLGWDACLDGCCLWWTGQEESRWMIPTLRFLVDHWFRQGAVGEGHPRLAAFTFDHVLDGLVVVHGCSRSMVVQVSSNEMTCREVREVCDALDLGDTPQRQPDAEQQGTAGLPPNVIDFRSRLARGGGGAAG